MDPAVRWLIVLAWLGGGCFLHASAVLDRPAAFQRGMTLGLFNAESAEGPLLEEVRSTGATDVSLVITWQQEDLAATEVVVDPSTPSDDRLRAAIRRAHGLGLRVMLFPLVRLCHRTAREWRGLLQPHDLDRWFASYDRRLLQLAALAAEERVERLSIGSELVSLERYADRWRELVRATRARYHGELLYSANWDRYSEVPFWQDVDLIGISAYWGVTPPGAPVTAEEAIAAWQPIRRRLVAFGREHRRPIVFTEIGYPSVSGAGAWPWNDFLTGADGAKDDEAQRRLYEAFTVVWSSERGLAGVYFWIWDEGGFSDRGYSPRDKPAELVVRSWFRPLDRLPPPR
jgi:hypothetical protein